MSFAETVAALRRLARIIGRGRKERGPELERARRFLIRRAELAPVEPPAEEYRR